MIGAAANNYMHVIGSQKQRERDAELEWAAVSGEDRCVTTLITAAKETTAILDWWKTLAGKLWYHIGFEKFRFQNVFCPQENSKPAFSNPSSLKNLFEKFRFRDRLVVDVGPNCWNTPALLNSSELL